VPRPARRALALLLTGTVLAACSSEQDSPGASATSDPVPTTTTTLEPTTTTASLVGAELVVTEQGVTSFPDPYDPTATLGGYGVVLENPDPDLMATGVRVVTRILDASGAELLVDSSLLNGILPGQRMAVGRTLIEPIEGPSRLEVSVEVSAWLPPSSTEGRLVAEDVVTEPEEAGGSVTRFTIRSSWPETEEGVDVTAVYRGADGRVLAADYTTVAIVQPDQAVSGQIRLLSPIPDLATTEVFVGRGFAALTAG
jgi:hypothetical protein